MFNHMPLSIGLGAAFTSMAVGLTALGLCFYWAFLDRTGHSSDFALLIIAIVPASLMCGALGGAILFCMVGLVVSLSRGSIAAGPMSYAIIGTLLWLALIILVTFRTGGEGIFGIVPMTILPMITAGALVGWRVKKSSAAPQNRRALDR